jgi:CheY-like chemotaxis protein
MYRSKLTIEQFTVQTADNGMEAIKLLSQEKPDVVLLDLMLPVMDGFKVLQVIKTDPKLSDIPVLVFSARGQPEEIEKAMSLGAAGYIIKATTKPNEVIEQIRKVLIQKPKAQELTHYIVEIKEDGYDARKLIADFSLDDLKCKKCRGPLLLELFPDFSHETPWFNGRFFCPKCLG